MTTFPTNLRLFFGPLAATILAVGVAALARRVPGYSHTSQTVSEIGELGSPARVPFSILLLCVALCVLVFASGVRDRARQAGHSRSVAYLIGAMAVSVAGVGVFAYPHPLHNVFGLSELVGYQAPLAFAIAWRCDPQGRALVRFSWFMSFVVWLAIALNLTSLDRHGSLWELIGPYYGLAQRALFAGWFGWCGVVGILLARPRGEPGAYFAEAR